MRLLLIVTCLTGIEEGAGQQAEIYNEAGKKKRCEDYSFSVVTQHRGN